MSEKDDHVCPFCNHDHDNKMELDEEVELKSDFKKEFEDFYDNTMVKGFGPFGTFPVPKDMARAVFKSIRNEDKRRKDARLQELKKLVNIDAKLLRKFGLGDIAEMLLPIAEDGHALPAVLFAALIKEIRELKGVLKRNG